MPIEIGRVVALYRYPVKSMRGDRLDAATLGWHGLEGDRRLAFRRTNGGAELAALGNELAPDVARRPYAPVQMTRLNHSGKSYRRCRLRPRNQGAQATRAIGISSTATRMTPARTR